MRRPELPERRGRGMWWYPSWTGIDKLQEDVYKRQLFIVSPLAGKNLVGDAMIGEYLSLIHI